MNFQNFSPSTKILKKNIFSFTVQKLQANVKATLSSFYC